MLLFILYQSNTSLDLFQYDTLKHNLPEFNTIFINFILYIDKVKHILYFNYLFQKSHNTIKQIYRSINFSINTNNIYQVDISTFFIKKFIEKLNSNHIINIT